MSSLSHAASRALTIPAEGLRTFGVALRKLAILTLGAVVLAGIYLGWGRDLPLFQISSVEVTGTEDALVTGTVTEAARQMTTLHVRQERFDQLAAGFPAVRSIQADPDFPTGLTITVEMREPVAIAKLGERTVPVAADGTLLPGVRVDGKVPSLAADARGPAVVGDAADQLVVLGAAPKPLLELVSDVKTRNGAGITVELEGGVEVRFGTRAAAERKWASAAAVLADDRLTGLTYVDVSAPERPAVGGAIGGPQIAVEVDLAAEDPVAIAPETAAIAPEAALAPADPASEAVPVAPESDPAATAAPEPAVDGAVSPP